MTTYYVAKNGNDNGAGTSGSPFKTISKAMKANLKPGDEVVVRSGTYNENVNIQKDGNANKYITIRSEVPGGAKIDPPGNKAGIDIFANYVKIVGFEVYGSQVSGIRGSNVHHVEIINNIVHDNVRDGIFLGRGDFWVVEGNVVYDNAAAGGSSGIHFKAAYNVSGASSNSGFRIIARDNVAYGNETKFGATTDGNGIILDDFRNTQVKQLPAYKFKTLVEGNIVYDNSGRGIQAAWSDYATIRDNIAIHNNADGRSGPWRGELSNMGSNQNTWTGNVAISHSRADNPAIVNVTFKGDPTNKNVAWFSNTTFNGKAGDDAVFTNAGNSKPTAANGNKLGKDPDLSMSEVKAMAKKLTSFPDTGSSSKDTASNDSTPTPDKGVDKGSSNAGVTLVGKAGQDKLVGGAGDDRLNGANGNDHLKGAGGDDILIGGNGVDTLVGGAGDDEFVYTHQSAAQRGDVISDFADGDTINLKGIDANLKAAGNQAFDFIGSKAFSGHAGELRYAKGVVSGDVDGDGKSDFHIDIANHYKLDAHDFIL